MHYFTCKFPFLATVFPSLIIYKIAEYWKNCQVAEKVGSFSKMGFTHSVYVVPNPILAMRVDKENLTEIMPASLGSTFTGREHSGSFLEGKIGRAHV